PVRLRCASSCGEPLNAEVVAFFRRVWGVTVMDQYGSSEFGLPIGNFNALEMDVRPGSMGLPLPGCRMAVVDDDGPELARDVVGQIAMRPSDVGYYSLGYWQDAERTRDLFRGPWMISGRHRRPDALHLRKVRGAAGRRRRRAPAHRGDDRIHRHDRELPRHGGGQARDLPATLPRGHRRHREGPPPGRRPHRDLGGGGSARAEGRSRGRAHAQGLVLPGAVPCITRPRAARYGATRQREYFAAFRDL